MTEPNYPTENLRERRADQAVHLLGLVLALGAGGTLLANAALYVEPALVGAVTVYVMFSLASNISSATYHFSPRHDKRVLLRRIDHAAIYPVIAGTFTPFFVQAGTTWTLTLLWLCWGLTALAIWHKITGTAVQARWSTASYLGLGALGMSALPDLGAVPLATLWCIIGGAVCYVIGTAFYVRRGMPYRYSLWHLWVNFGAIAMFSGIWIALFHSA